MGKTNFKYLVVQLKRSSCFDLEMALAGGGMPDQAVLCRGLHIQVGESNCG